MPNKNENSKQDSNALPHTPYILNGELYQIQTRIGENVTVKCCNCPPDRIYRGSVRSTGNFHMHIKRRHSALLGKLHDMKVKALSDRRDRLRLRTNSSRRAKTSCMVEEEKRELKIKTVFKRHKQEKQQQQIDNKVNLPGTSDQKPIDLNNLAAPVAESTAQTESKNLCSMQTKPIHPYPTNVSNADNSTESFNAAITSTPNINLQDGNSVSTQTTDRNLLATNFLRTFGLVPLAGLIKPEQPLPSEQSRGQLPLDLSTQNISNSSINDTANTLDATPNIAHHISVSESGHETSSISIENFCNKIAQMENTLNSIHKEMMLRNQIESKRMLLDFAKFKYQHPDFVFQI